MAEVLNYKHFCKIHGLVPCRATSIEIYFKSKI